MSAVGPNHPLVGVENAQHQGPKPNAVLALIQSLQPDHLAVQRPRQKNRLFRVLSGRRSQIEFPTVEVDGVDEVRTLC